MNDKNRYIDLVDKSYFNKVAQFEKDIRDSFLLTCLDFERTLKKYLLNNVFSGMLENDFKDIKVFVDQPDVARPSKRDVILAKNCNVEVTTDLYWQAISTRAYTAERNYWSKFQVKWSKKTNTLSIFDFIRRASFGQIGFLIKHLRNEHITELIEMVDVTKKKQLVGIIDSIRSLRNLTAHEYFILADNLFNRLKSPTRVKTFNHEKWVKFSNYEKFIRLFNHLNKKGIVKKYYNTVDIKLKGLKKTQALHVKYIKTQLNKW